MLKQLSSILVYVHDMPRAVVFYRDVLGLPLDMESPGFSQFQAGNGVALGLHVAHGEMKSPEPGWVPSFDVEDIRAARERVVAGGGRITLDYHDIPGGVIFELADPDGNRIGVVQMGVSCADLGVAAHA
jgi:predicted enzyme related to lactoylglutathione lyase